MDPTTSVRYWLHWEVAVCFLSVAACFAASAFLVWKYEFPRTDRRAERGAGVAGTGRRAQSPREVYKYDAWRPNLPVHPGWLLLYRTAAFVFFLAHNIVIISRVSNILFFYTEWTFTLVTVYFGLATALSIWGCIKFAGEGEKDIERGTNGEDKPRELAGFWTYVLQIVYQTSAGAAMFTDCVFWLILFPYIRAHGSSIGYRQIVMHSLNLVFLLGDAALHSLPFPWFRMAYLFLFTSVYVIFQWGVHASHNIWWPYPFLELSSKRAPLLYIAAGLIQLPCYGAFWLLTHLKQRMMTVRGSPPSPAPTAVLSATQPGAAKASKLMET